MMLKINSFHFTCLVWILDYFKENEGYITFGEVPSDIVDDESKIEWAPLIPENENPWSVRLSDIVI